VRHGSISSMLTKRIVILSLLLAGCAAPPTRTPTKGTPPSPTSPTAAVPAHPWRLMAVYVPQTDDNAAKWPAWFAKSPNLRMVIAMSPRFSHFAKDPALKARLLQLRKEGRLEFGLQLPNPPILPLIIEDPPLGYPEDVVQLVARAKSGFYKTWGFLPQGLILPYGAISPRLVVALEQLGFNWIVAAVGMPSIDGAFQSGSMRVWDATPAGAQTRTVLRIWDERLTKGRPLDNWILETHARSGTFLLPSDAEVVTFPLADRSLWKPHTWDGSDWSAWIGSPNKDTAWNALKKTRAALEKFKNSGQASVQKLDIGFEEIYNAENANYFSVLDSTAVSPALVEDRQHEFQATLLSVYRVINQPPPEDLFSSSTAQAPSNHVSSTTVSAETLAGGGERITIGDAEGDSLLPGGSDLRTLEVTATTDTLRWVVTVTSAPPTDIDIYVDLNGQPNVGTPTFLPGRPYAPAPSDAWEYALSISGTQATLFRTAGIGTYGSVQTFPIIAEGARFTVVMPRDVIRGSPRRWAYQVLVMSGTLSDFIDPLDISQKDLWADLTSKNRDAIPFVRARK